MTMQEAGLLALGAIGWITAMLAGWMHIQAAHSVTMWRRRYRDLQRLLREDRRYAHRLLANGLEHAQNDDDPDSAQEALVAAVEVAMSVLRGAQPTTGGNDD